MWLLTVSVILFIIVIGFIIYGNWPPKSGDNKCGCTTNKRCPRCPCNRCGQSKSHCRCNIDGGDRCQFC